MFCFKIRPASYLSGCNRNLIVLSLPLSPPTTASSNTINTRLLFPLRFDHRQYKTFFFFFFFFVSLSFRIHVFFLRVKKKKKKKRERERERENCGRLLLSLWNKGVELYYFYFIFICCTSALCCFEKNLKSPTNYTQETLLLAWGRVKHKAT